MKESLFLSQGSRGTPPLNRQVLGILTPLILTEIGFDRDQVVKGNWHCVETLADVAVVENQPYTHRSVFRVGSVSKMPE